MALEYTVVELPPVWPGKKAAYHKAAPFKRPLWSRIEHVLDRELRHLGARKAQIAIDVRLGDLREDGKLRASARAKTPPTILSFIDRDGHRQAYPCDTFKSWEDNLWAIAIVLEDLRRAERYGVQSALIRAGFKALPAAGGTVATLSTGQAAHFIARMGGDDAGSVDLTAKTILDDRQFAVLLIRQARAKTHPDAGGRNEDWTLLQESERIIKAHHGGSL